MPADSVHCYPINSNFPGIPIVFTSVDTLLARTGDWVISSYMGLWGESILTGYIAALIWIVLARQRRGRYWVDQPMLAITGVWLFSKFSYKFLISTIPIWIGYGEVQGWPHSFIHLFIRSFSTHWKLILCLVWLDVGSTVLNKTAKVWVLLERHDKKCSRITKFTNATPRWWRKCHFFISYHLPLFPIFPITSSCWGRTKLKGAN